MGALSPISMTTTPTRSFDIDALLAQARQEAARFFSARDDDDVDATDAALLPPPVVLFAAPSLSAAGLSPCGHQAGGHHHHHGDNAALPASMVDRAGGRFCKLLPADGRARREARWYGRCARAAAAAEEQQHQQPQASSSALADLYRDFMPRYHGVAQVAGRWVLVLDDAFVAATGAAPTTTAAITATAAAESPFCHRHRCVMDVKLGRTTSYPWASPELAKKCERKDRETTQAALGLRLCGVHCERVATAAATETTTTWREDRHWGKVLAGAEDVRAALRRFAALGYEEEEEGEQGAASAAAARQQRRSRRRRRLVALAAEVVRLRACVARLSHARLFSASALLLLEVGQEEEEELEDNAADAAASVALPPRPRCRARVVLVDFAHAFVRPSFEGPDENVLAGLGALRLALEGAAAAE